MATARLPDANDAVDNAGFEYRFPNEQAVHDYIEMHQGRTREQLVAVATSAIMGFQMAPLMAVLKNTSWLWGPHGPGNKPVPDPVPDSSRIFSNPPAEVPPDLAPVMSLARDAVQAIDLLRELVPVAHRIREFFEHTPGAPTSLTAWDSDVQMFAAFAHFAAENAGFTPPLGRKELEAFALIAGIRRPVSTELGDGQGEFLADPTTTKQRADNWRRTTTRAEKNRILHVLRATTGQVGTAPAGDNAPRPTTTGSSEANPKKKKKRTATKKTSKKTARKTEKKKKKRKN